MIKPLNKAELLFDLIARIGHEGANSTVYQAKDHQLQATLAIKEVPKAKLGDVAEYYREASILYLSSHPNVVPIHYACEDKDNVYIAMPYYDSGSLNAILNNRHITVREIVRIGTHFLMGLHNIHTKGLIHFDVKPGNILLSPRGEALLSDFGVAKRVAYDGMAGQDRLYTNIRPPESFGKDNGFTIAFDIYQAGITLYRMCVGNGEFYRQFDTYGPKDAFNRDKFRFDVRNGKFPDRSVFPAHIPERLRRIIKKCLESSPADRPSSALTIVNELAEIDGEILDWSYEILETGSRKWTTIREDKSAVRLTIDETDNATALSISASGTERRIRDYCRTLSEKEIRKFLEGKRDA